MTLQMSWFQDWGNTIALVLLITKNKQLTVTGAALTVCIALGFQERGNHQVDGQESLCNSQAHIFCDFFTLNPTPL